MTNHTTQQATQTTGYPQQNNRSHFWMGLAAGAAVAYLLSNKGVQNMIRQTSGEAVSSAYGELEELKERLEDTQAELAYYRAQAQKQEQAQS